MATMKAGRLYGKQDMRVEDMPVPVPGPNQMVVKISYVGICGSDIEFYADGMLPPTAKFPMTLGHENSGVVCAVGDGVTNYKVGDRLLCGPPTACGDTPADMCPACKKGMPNICFSSLPRTAGIGGPDGGYAEYYLVRDVSHTMLVKVPNNVDLKDAVLFDVACVALHGIRRSKFKLGMDAVVSGTGTIGLCTIQFLKAAGANHIVALDVVDKAEVARQYGATLFINSKECKDVAGEIMKHIGRQEGCDIGFECSGNKYSLGTLWGNPGGGPVCPGGQIFLIGQIQVPIDNIVPSGINVREISLDFSFVYTEDEVKMYLDMLDQKKVAFPGLVTDIIALKDVVKKGLDRDDKAKMIKVLIDPSR
jgi:threonine dehydrogenase-like Zn-dependent dehydrogenase